MDIEKAIGENEKNDYILNISKHAEKYAENLPELSKLLQGSDIEYLAKEYEFDDKRAIACQKKYKQYSIGTRWTAFFATLFTVCITVSGALNGLKVFSFGTIDGETMAHTASILAIISSAVASVFIMLLKNKKLLSKWMESRSEAEEGRIGYFEKLVKKVQGKSVEAHLQLLEYFRRYQIDVQLNFYENKSKELEKKSNQSLTILAILAGTALIINGITGLGFDSKYSYLASLAIIVQALSFMMNNKELDEQNERNSERYGRTREILAQLKSKFDLVKNVVKNNDTKALSVYVKAVHEHLSIENKQWLKSMESSTMAIAELEKHINNDTNETNIL